MRRVFFDHLITSVSYRPTPPSKVRKQSQVCGRAAPSLRFLGTVSITRAYRARTSLAAGGMSDVMLLYGMSKTTPVAAPNVHPVSHRIGRHSRTTGTETVS